MAKSDKQKLFEAMGKVDPSFNTKNTKKILKEYWANDPQDYPEEAEFTDWEIGDWTPGDLEDSTLTFYDNQHGSGFFSLQDLIDHTSKGDDSQYDYWRQMTHKDQKDPQLNAELEKLVQKYGDSQNWNFGLEYDGSGEGEDEGDYYYQLRKDEPDQFRQ